MNPELEAQAREVLTRVLARDDFPEVLVAPVSTYLVTGRAQDLFTVAVFNGILSYKYRAVFWLMHYLIRSMESDVEYYMKDIRAYFSIYDS